METHTHIHKKVNVFALKEEEVKKNNKRRYLLIPSTAYRCYYYVSKVIFAQKYNN